MKVSTKINLAWITAKTTLWWHYYHKCKLDYNKLSELESQAVKSLYKNGYFVLEDYWPKTMCEKYVKLLKQIHHLAPVDYDSGAYLRNNKSQKDVADQGVSRLYHADREFQGLKSFRNDPIIKRIFALYYGHPMYSSFTAFQVNLPTCQTRGFHLDGYTSECKAFIYLQDVGIDNGPFCYINGSNKTHYLRYRKLIKGEDTGIKEKDIENIQSRRKMLTAKAGALILVDVCGIHRGMPQYGDERMVLYNNFIPRNHETFPRKDN